VICGVSMPGAGRGGEISVQTFAAVIEEKYPPKKVDIDEKSVPSRH
jgi:hypothetical protein